MLEGQNYSTLGLPPTGLMRSSSNGSLLPSATATKVIQLCPSGSTTSRGIIGTGNRGFVAMSKINTGLLEKAGLAQGVSNTLSTNLTTRNSGGSSLAAFSRNKTQGKPGA
jgi:hypothetical protein